MPVQHVSEHLLDVVEGWTGVLGPFTLRVDDVPLALTGLTVTLAMRRQSGAVVTPGGTVTPDPDQITNPGQFSYTPAANDFTYEPNLYTNTQTYKLHWKVVDGAGKIVYFPSGAPAEICVHRA